MTNTINDLYFYQNPKLLRINTLQWGGVMVTKLSDVIILFLIIVRKNTKKINKMEKKNKFLFLRFKLLHQLLRR